MVKGDLYAFPSADDESRLRFVRVISASGTMTRTKMIYTPESADAVELIDPSSVLCQVLDVYDSVDACKYFLINDGTPVDFTSQDFQPFLRFYDGLTKWESDATTKPFMITAYNARPAISLLPQIPSPNCPIMHIALEMNI